MTAEETKNARNNPVDDKTMSEIIQNEPFLPMPDDEASAGMAPLELPAVQDAIAEGEARLAAQGRLLIRKSGTEPLIRVMGECEDEALLRDVVMGIAGKIREQ